MDWMPTLIEAAVDRKNSSLTTDGESIMPALAGGVAVSRTLFWRHRSNDQQAMRDGCWKYLRIGGKEALFDLEQDQRERADVRTLHAARFAAMKAAFAGWNATMLPYPTSSFSESQKNHMIDRY